MSHTKQTTTQKIAPNLWFDGQAEEAVQFYSTIFANSKIIKISRYSADTPSNKPKGSVLTVEFEIEGQKFTALNGGPHFKFTPAVSFFINCDTEDEVDTMWAKLSGGGQVLMPLDKYDFSKKYGWIQDKYGVSWQVILSQPQGEWRPKIIPCLLFTGKVSGKAKKAIEFYTSVFRNSEMGFVAPYEEPERMGKIAFGDFKIEGELFAAMDSPQDDNFAFNEAISFIVYCETQQEVDDYWGKLSAVPESEQCGWVKDKYGVSWQIIPKILIDMIADPDTEKATKVMEAMLQMKKLNIEALEQAYSGKLVNS